jgi:hypothetical protein
MMTSSCNQGNFRFSDDSALLFLKDFTPNPPLFVGEMCAVA